MAGVADGFSGDAEVVEPDVRRWPIRWPKERRVSVMLWHMHVWQEGLNELRFRRRGVVFSAPEAKR